MNRSAPEKAAAAEPLLRVRNLQVDMQTEQGSISILRNISFDLRRGESLGIVGESGSGKTVTCLSLLRLLTSPPAVYRSGEVFFEGNDLWKIPPRQLQEVRGRHIAFIFQEALSALNPVMKVGEQIAESVRRSGVRGGEETRRTVIELLERVGVSDAPQRLQQYPHQLSGGLQQRIMIAMALACRPQILIADEPTTALDVTIQVQILSLLKDLQQETGMSLIFISHDLGVVAEVCRRILVMYAGQVVEMAETSAMLASPQHPYSQLLLQAIPSLSKPRGKLKPIPGQIPSPTLVPGGCPFHPRCPEVQAHCRRENPRLLPAASNGQVRCWQRQTSTQS